MTHSKKALTYSDINNRIDVFTRVIDGLLRTDEVPIDSPEAERGWSLLKDVKSELVLFKHLLSGYNQRRLPISSTLAAVDRPLRTIRVYSMSAGDAFRHYPAYKAKVERVTKAIMNYLSFIASESNRLGKQDAGYVPGTNPELVNKVKKELANTSYFDRDMARSAANLSEAKNIVMNVASSITGSTTMVTARNEVKKLGDAIDAIKDALWGISDLKGRGAELSVDVKMLVTVVQVLDSIYADPDRHIARKTFHNLLIQVANRLDQGIRSIANDRVRNATRIQLLSRYVAKVTGQRTR